MIFVWFLLTLTLKSCNLLGVHINKHLKWDDQIKHTVSECYDTLSILRKLKYLAKYELSRQLAETLILSKPDYANLFLYPLPQFLLRHLQRVQFAAASFALKLCITLRLGQIILKQKKKQKKNECRKELRSSNSIRLLVPTKNGTFQDNVSKLPNNLPETIRNCKDYRTFLKLSRNFFL